MGRWIEVLRRCAQVFADAWRQRDRFRRVERTRSEAEFLPAELEVLDSPPWPLARMVLWMIVLLMLIFLIWSYLGQLDIVATSRGSIIPDSRTKVIQSAVEGTVAAIEVADGDAVAAGDVLIRMGTVSARAERERLSSVLQAALLASAMGRLLAAVDFQAPSAAWPPRLAGLPELAGIDAGQVAVQQQVLDSLFWKQWAQAEHFSAQRRTKQAELQLHVEQADFIREIIEDERNLVSLNVAEAENLLKNAEAEFPMAQQQLDSTLILREKGIISLGAVHVEKTEMLHLKSRLVRLATNRERLLVEGRLQLVQRRKEISQNENQAARIEADIAQMQTSENLALAEFRSGMVDMAAIQSRQAHALRQEAIQAESRLASHEIVAPEAGVVEQLAVHTAGAVVQPGQALMMIVPRDARLVAEVEILNKDVGFVHEGQSVRVKVDAFNYTRYGLIDGEVMDVADDAVEREGMGAVFRMRIRLLQDEMVVEGKTVRLRPGMSVTAEVRTGERRVIDFFLDPFRRARDESLNVR